MYMPVESVVDELARESEPIAIATSPLRLTAFVLLLCAAPLYEAFRVAAFASGDIWWHLRTGLWILKNHAAPLQGLFSQNLNSRWIDSAWGFEVLVAAAYKLLGLRSISLLLMLFKLALGAMTFLMAGGWRRNFWSALLLSAAVQYILLDLPLLPIVCSILCFGIELILLLESRRQSDARYLYWLPPLFFLWANLDVQFVNGLFLLALFMAADITERSLRIAGVSPFPSHGYSLAKTAATAVLSLAATLLTPYSFHLFPEALESAYGHVPFKFFSDMAALAFRQSQDFVLLLLVMAAFLALGRQRSRDLFKCAVMIFSVMLAFRVARDVWCAALPAIAIIAGALPKGPREGEALNSGEARKFDKPLVLALCLTLVLLAFARIPSDEILLKRASRTLPIKACDFIRANQLPAPVFNSYAWGGFLIWYLPEYPVAMDGRLSLYGRQASEQYFDMMSGTVRLENNPVFVRARTLLLEQNSGLAKALTTLPVLRSQFSVVYQDHLAVVLVRK
ncbi:MAG: hypothetical protein WB384_02740 [Candidatus Sulfotelmatobacter sp.]